MISQFNIRVYALVEHQNRFLLLKEPFMGKMIHKFPGGGLEFGEGVIDCLKREFKEELNLEIKKTKHFYTQEDFIETPAHPEKQLLLLYYKVSIQDFSVLNVLDPDIEEIKWISRQELSPDLFYLDVDQIVVRKLLLQL